MPSTIPLIRSSLIISSMPPLGKNEHLMSLPQLRLKYGHSINVQTPKDSPGLDDAGVAASIAHYGSNKIPTPRKPSIFSMYIQKTLNLFSAVLFICGGLSIIVFIIDTTLWVNLYTGLIFWAVALFNAALEFWQQYNGEKLLESLQVLVPAAALARRNDALVNVQVKELVAGDIVYLKPGNKVPADLRILWSDNLRVDNSSITGESEPQPRSCNNTKQSFMDAECLVFAGTIIVTGEAVCLVTNVGPNSVMGKLAISIITESRKISDLEQEMTVFFRRLVLVAVLTALTGLIVGFSQGLDVTHVLDLFVGIAVSFLPQGLPATMTILLTSAAKRMAKKNVLVKEIRSVETLGSLNVLATDKTGTLTMNEMTVVGGWIHEKIYNSAEMMQKQVHQNFFKEAALCTSCKFNENGETFGEACDLGIINFSKDLFDPLNNLNQNPRIAEIPFNSIQKWHAVIHSIDGSNTLIIKGAPERIIRLCKLSQSGENIRYIDDKFRETFDKTYEYFAKDGLRIIAFANVQLDEAVNIFDVAQLNSIASKMSLKFTGFLCLRDPPKPRSLWTVRKLRNAGIKVVMITGDHYLTAQAIARQVGILTQSKWYKNSLRTNMEKLNSAVISGEAIEIFTTADWDNLLALDELVFARTTPSQKLEIVKQLQRTGNIVGVCGDGINDAPALRCANLGISMNLTGSDVSKEAAHMILLDDDFGTLVKGVFEGRLIFENIKKSIRYTLTHIFPEISALLLFSLLLIPPPLSPILLLMIDVFAELGPAISFAWEPPELDLLTSKKPLVTRMIEQVNPDVLIEHDYNSAHNPVPKESITLKWLRTNRVTKIFFRDSKKNGVINTDLITWSFFQGGIINAIGSWGTYVLVIAVEHVPFSNLYKSYPTYFTETSPDLILTNGTVADANSQVIILGRVQAAFFQAIIICQLLNIFAQKHRKLPPYGWDLFMNPVTYFGIFTALLVLSIVAYIPGLNYIFDTYIPPALSLPSPFTAGIVILLYELVRRSIFYPHAQPYYTSISDELTNPQDDPQRLSII